MFKYILKRIGFSILALFILLILVFTLMQLIPGYPLARGQKESEATYQSRLAAAGLLKSPFEQFWIFIQGLFHGTFGTVYNGSITSVTDKFLKPISNTLIIATPAFVLSSIVGIGLGIVSAYYRGKWPDTIINIIAVAFVSIPSFIFALYLMKLAGLVGLPTQFVAPDTEGATAGQIIESAIMPVLSMAFASVSSITYYTRNELVDVFKQDYIKTALSKGISFRKVVFTHAMRNAAIPILAALLPSFMGILSGSIIIESFFNVPGTASILVAAVQQKEMYLVMFSAFFYSGIYFGLQIILDVTCTIIDPRIVLAEESTTSLYKQAKMKISRYREFKVVNA